MRCAPILALVLLAVGVAAGGVTDSSSPEQQLADRYAPIVALKQQSEPCSSDGEPYRPVPVDPLFARSDVRLVDSSGRLIRTAPTAADLYGRGDRTYLDLPGLAARSRLPLRAVGRPGLRRQAHHRVRACRHRAGQAGQARPPVLALLPVQRLEQQARVRLGDGPADVRRLDGVGGARAQPHRGGLLPARGRRAGRPGRRQAREAGNPPGRLPGPRVARELLRAVGLARPQRAGGLWLRQHDRTVTQAADARRPPSRQAACVRVGAVRLARLRRSLGPEGERPEHGSDRAEHEAAVDRAGHLVGRRVAGQQHQGALRLDARHQRDQLLLRRGRRRARSSTSNSYALRGSCSASSRRSPCSASGSAGGRSGRRTSPFPIDRARSAGQIYRAAFKLYRRYRLLFVGIGLIFVPLSVVGVVAAADPDPAPRESAHSSTRPRATRSSPVSARCSSAQLSAIFASIAVTAAVACALGRIHGATVPMRWTRFGGSSLALARSVGGGSG